jgi:glyoxylase-like metal-dependent hydrolase (beta-lactamase superfamily II)
MTTTSEPGVLLDLCYAGSCVHPEAMVVGGAPLRPATFPSLFAVIRHPRAGITLFDTGYAPRFLDETRRLPAALYRWLTPMTLAEGGSAAAQLRARGVEPAAVDRIILSHFHADHIAGVRDFPRARFVATADAWRAVSEASAFGRLRRGFLPGLLPLDFASRVDLLEAQDFRAPTLRGLAPGHDLFGDGSVVLVPLPGHAAGQVGALVRGASGARTFLVADAAWTTASFRDNRPSHPIAGIILDAPREAARVLTALHDLARDDPSLDIVPSHCAARARAASGAPTSSA